MNTIAVVEYLNYVNEESHAIGHGKKVLHEACNLLGDTYRLQCISSVEYAPDNDAVKMNYIPSIKQFSKNNNLSVIFNIIRSMLLCKAELLWFTNVEWRLLALLAFVPKKKKIIVTMYRDVVQDVDVGHKKLRRLKLWLMNKGLSHIDTVFVTNPNLKISDRQIFVPDYCYDSKYIKYEGVIKKDQVLCVGAMRKSKDLRGVLNHFKDTDITICIIGGFSDKNELKWLEDNRTSNIIIEDRFLPDDEYYQLIAQSRYIIMPYDMHAYREATSGILQEAVFLGSVPIAPEELLRYNGILGIGYNDWEDLPKCKRDFQDLSENIRNDISEYVEDNIRRKIIDRINGILKE